MQGCGSDVTDAQWAPVAPLSPDTKTRGEPRRHHRRLVVEAIVYVLDDGVTWRNLPTGFPPKATVDDSFARWRDDGTRQRVHDALRDRARAARGKAPGPTAAIIDSQSAKTTEKGAIAAGMGARTSRGASGTSWWTRRAG